MAISYKAIQITEDNVERLVMQYRPEQEGDFDNFPIGFWLISSFGSLDFSVVNDDFFHSHFLVIGEIENDYVIIA